MSNSARRAIYHRIRHMTDDRVVRIVAIIAVVLVTIVEIALRPGPRYFIDEKRCKDFSENLLICPKNAQVQR